MPSPKIDPDALTDRVVTLHVMSRHCILAEMSVSC